jgi:SLT domain-containing protein
MEQLKQKAIELTPALQGMFAQVSPLVKPFAEGLSGLAERAIPGVTDSLRQSMPMMNGFRDGMGTLGAKTGEMFRGFGQGSEGLGQTWRVVGGQFGTFLASIGGFVGKFSSESATSLDKTLQGVNNLTSGMLNGLGPALQAMAGGNSIWFSLFTAIGSFFEKIGPSLGAFTEALGGALGPTIEKLGGSLGILVAAGLQGMSVMLPVVTPLIVGAAQAILSFVQFLEGLGPVLPIVMGVIMGMRLLSLATTVLAGSKMVVTAATVAWKIAMIAVRAVIFVVRAAAFALHLTYLLLTSSAMAQTVATKAVAAATIIGANAMKVLRIAMFALSSHPLVALFVALGAVIMILVARAGGLSGIWEKIKAGWNGLVNFFQPTIDFFKTLIGGIIHWFQHLWDVLLGHSIIPDIVNGAKKWFGMIWDIVGIIVRIVGAVIAKWVEFFTFMVKIFKLYLDVVFAVWGWIWDNILSKVVAVIGWVLGKIGDFFPLIVAAFNLYKDIVFAVWSWLWDNIFSKVFDVLGWIKNKWDEWWPVFKLSFEILRDTVMDIWNWLWDNVLTKIGDALGWVKDRFDLWWEAFKFGFELLRDTLMGIWNWLWDNILTKIGDAIGKAQEKFTAFKDKFGEILENLRSKAEEVWNKIKETFARPINVIIGFINDKILDNIGMGDKKIPKIEGYADGGTIPGAGHGRADDRLARVSSGEYIVNARAAEVNRPLLDQINYRGFIPKFADGGPVEWMSNWVRGVEPSMTMTSGLRFTDNGYHSRGMAADFSNGTATTPEMQNLAKRINETWGAQTLELIHTGPYNIKDGANVGDGMGVYGAATMAGHDNHVHWAVPGPLDDSQSGPSLLGKVGNFLGGVFNKGRELMSALFQRLSQPVLDGIPDPFTPGMGDKMGRAPKGLATMVRDRMAEMIRGKENTGGMLGGDIGGLVPDGERLKIIEEAMRITGTPPPDGAEDWVRGMNTLITRESGWNAGIINNWDSNAAAGMPSQGLAQVIPPTFNAHKVPGHDNILDPVSNVAASINYIKSQYGSIKNVQQANANMPPKGYKDGTENATPGWAMVGEEGPEMVKFRGGEEVVPLQDFTSKLSSAAESTGLRTKAETALTDAGKSMFDTFFQDLTGGGYESGFLGQLVKQGIDYGGKVASQSVTNNWNVVDVDEAMRKYKQQQKEQAIGYDY